MIREAQPTPEPMDRTQTLMPSVHDEIRTPHPAEASKALNEAEVIIDLLSIADLGKLDFIDDDAVNNAAMIVSQKLWIVRASIEKQCRDDRDEEAAKRAKATGLNVAPPSKKR